jgi:hypothetical protein
MGVSKHHHKNAAANVDSMNQWEGEAVGACRFAAAVDASEAATTQRAVKSANPIKISTVKWAPSKTTR